MGTDKDGSGGFHSGTTLTVNLSVDNDGWCVRLSCCDAVMPGFINKFNEEICFFRHVYTVCWFD